MSSSGIDVRSLAVNRFFVNMPTLLPRESTRAISVVSAHIQRPSPSEHRVGFSDIVSEATCRFTCVTACSLAVSKLTTPCCHDAASSCYRGVRTIPRTGLEPARFTAVTANGQHRFVFIFQSLKIKPILVPFLFGPFLLSPFSFARQELEGHAYSHGQDRTSKLSIRRH
jgi:hypothetical protein